MNINNVMSIDKLRKLGYHKIAEAALYNALENGGQSNVEKTSISGIFTWNTSPEGQNFWCQVVQGDFEAALETCPQFKESVVEEKTKNITIKSNGLFK